VLSMEVIAEIRRRHLVSGESISAIARDLKLSRPTVRKHLQTESEAVYLREHQPRPSWVLSGHVLESWLTTERHLPKAQRRTAQRLFEGLQAEGYRGAYDSVQRFVKQWKSAQTRPTIKEAFVPLVFAPGDACQFDWSQEHVEIDGVALTIKVAHFRLAYSRQMFVVAYPSETQEMVLDAHSRAFAFFGGVPKRMIYDNLKTVVDTILVGKDRHFNRRFMALGEPLPVRARCLHAGLWLGERANRESGRQRAGMAVHAQGPLQELCGAERLAGQSLPGTGASASIRLKRCAPLLTAFFRKARACGPSAAPLTVTSSR
jgi:transposase